MACLAKGVSPREGVGDGHHGVGGIARRIERGHYSGVEHVRVHPFTVHEDVDEVVHRVELICHVSPHLRLQRVLLT